MSGISTHVLDIAAGKPAVDMPVTLAVESGGTWTLLFTARTDGDGRCRQLLPEGSVLAAGTYRLRFETETYYARRPGDGLYPFVEINFTVRPTDEHLHIPLLLAANGYTTYRGT